MAAQKNTGPAVELAVLLMFPCDELEESFTGLEAGADALTPAKTRREEGIVLIMKVDGNEVAGDSEDAGRADWTEEVKDSQECGGTGIAYSRIRLPGRKGGHARASRSSDIPVLGDEDSCARVERIEIRHTCCARSVTADGTPRGPLHQRASPGPQAPSQLFNVPG